MLNHQADDGEVAAAARPSKTRVPVIGSTLDHQLDNGEVAAFARAIEHGIRISIVVRACFPLAELGPLARLASRPAEVVKDDVR